MNTFTAGDTSKGICSDCGLVGTTFKLRTVTVEDVLAITIMAGICDECDSIVSTPTQSTPTIRDAMVQILEVKTI